MTMRILRGRCGGAGDTQQALQVHVTMFDHSTRQKGKSLVFPIAYYLPKTTEI